jgi:hypothetical protein
MAFDLGHPEKGESAISQALEKASAIVARLLPEGAEVAPGDLRNN